MVLRAGHLDFFSNLAAFIFKNYITFACSCLLYTSNQALDIETDISVMNQMLAREGLSDESADTIIKAARSGKTE